MNCQSHGDWRTAAEQLGTTELMDWAHEMESSQHLPFVIATVGEISWKISEFGQSDRIRKVQMSYFPIYLEMKGRPCFVVGGGAVAERKIASLLEVGAAVTVISPAVSETIAGWAKDHLVEVIARRYQAGDLAEFELAFVATDDGEVSAQVFAEGRKLGVWVNAADDPRHCDFILPSVLRRGDLTVAVSTAGTSPALARTIREELEIYFTEDYELLAQLAAEVRKELLARSISAPFETWRRALSGDVRQLLMRGEVARAKSLLLRELGVGE